MSDIRELENALLDAVRTGEPFSLQAAGAAVKLLNDQQHEIDRLNKALDANTPSVDLSITKSTHHVKSYRFCATIAEPRLYYTEIDVSEESWSDRHYMEDYLPKHAAWSLARLIENEITPLCATAVQQKLGGPTQKQLGGSSQEKP